MLARVTISGSQHVGFGKCLMNGKPLKSRGPAKKIGPGPTFVKEYGTLSTTRPRTVKDD